MTGSASFLLEIVLAIFGAALLAPFLARRAPRAVSWVFAGLLAAATFWFAVQSGAIAQGERLTSTIKWLPAAKVSLTLQLDGLGLLFALMICGTGSLVALYSGPYFGEHEPHLPRYYGYLLLFTASMLGVVTAGDLISLYIFWELTTIASFFLIGFEHGKESARKAALQALFVTTLGGLSLLAGIVLLGQAAGSFGISDIIAGADAVRTHAHYDAILILIAAGAVAKSAQFPLHFWLPGAMAAPTPVSAYLHSATMVKAGLYLVARFHPALGGSALWFWLFTCAGALTLLAGALGAVRQNDLKRILAYMTVAALGALMMLLGIGTKEAIKAFTVYLLAHSLYKGALFMVVGIIDHETGTRDIRRLGGLSKRLKLTFAGAALASVSMIGLPPLVGFTGKELIYDALLRFQSHTPATVPSFFPPALIALTVVGLSVVVAAAAIAVVRPFLGTFADSAGGSLPTRGRAPHSSAAGEPSPSDPAPSMWIPPLILGATSIAAWLTLGGLGSHVLLPAASAIAGASLDLRFETLHFTTGALLLSAVSLAGGTGIYLLWNRLAARPARISAAGLYETTVNRVFAFARWQTSALQSGSLRWYLRVSLTASVLFVAYIAWMEPGWIRVNPAWEAPIPYDFFIGVLLIAGIAGSLVARETIVMVIALGAVGYSIALIYLVFGAPDLALTQFLVETLFVFLVTLIFTRLPVSQPVPSRIHARIPDVIIAAAVGTTMTLVSWATTSAEFPRHLSEYFAETAPLEAHGRNLVNTILADFRALDTLGEIGVIAASAVGIMILIRFRNTPGGAP